jgi:uncharacterized protein YdeI (YjbR/CyaY-like superfamily)
VVKPARPSGKELRTVYPRTRAAWRRWLAKHHADSPPVWLIYDKQETGKCRLRYAEAVEEALCFGWIDSLVKTIDESRYMQFFSPRKARSAWSMLNKARVARLIDLGLMTAAGLVKVEAARKDGSWTRQDATEALEIPPDLAKALRANPAARKNFQAFPPSTRKGFLFWLGDAKLPATRARRVREIVARAARKRRLERP